MDRRCLGFSLYEILIVVVLVGIVSSFAIPQVMKARVRAFAATETENLRMIEAAKAACENPGVAISSETQLYPFLPGEKLPESPWGVQYENVTDLTRTAASPANGVVGKEPPVEPLGANGFNDLGTAGLVYYERLEPSAYRFWVREWFWVR